MKKFALVLLVLLLLGGGGYYLYSKSGQKLPGTEQSGGVFGSIKDALSKSLSLQCEFTDDQGVATVAYMKAGAVRVNTTGKTTEESGSFIMKDKKLYFWQKGSKEGTLMTMSDEKVTVAPGKTEPTGTADEKSGNVLSELEKFKDKCKAAVVDDSLFTPPSDVKFTDFSKMMPSIPAGGKASEQDVQKLMQQYQNTSGN